MPHPLTKRDATREGADDRLEFESPIGRIRVELGPTAVRRLEFVERDWNGAASSRGEAPPEPARASELHALVTSELAAYFRGELAAIDRIPVDPPGTPFQKHVWSVLRQVPAGSTVSYGELARRAGAPDAVRAVGACNARNPVAIVVPCHRVIGADGTLTGYGGGLARKRWLLDHEASRGTLFGRGSAR